jgi:uncharacterized protein (TIGR02145 family)
MKTHLFITLISALFLMYSCKNEKELEEPQIQPENFTDERDGTTYRIVKIGEQWWMAENLAYLPSVSSVENESLNNPVNYVYQYNGTDVNLAKATENYKTYGVLYNWSAAMTACPEGWHLPTDDEWKQLELYIGMTQSEVDDRGWRGIAEGGKLKSLSGWEENGNGTDDYNFGGLPGGSREIRSVESSYVYPTRYTDKGHYGTWWSATEHNNNGEVSVVRVLNNKDGRIIRNPSFNQNGFSVRCVKD